MHHVWTRAKLKKAIKRLITQPNVIIRRFPLKKNLAQSTWERKRNGNVIITIYVDEHQVGLVSSVIHELLHIAAEHELKLFDNEIEEWTVNGWETGLYKHIENSPSQLAWWRREIERRLK